MANKFDDNNIIEIDLLDLELDDVEDLMTAKGEVRFKDVKYCYNCNHIFGLENNDYEEYHICPYCGKRDYGSCYQDDLDYDTFKNHTNNILDIEDMVGKEIADKIIEILKKEEVVKKVDTNKMSLQEATIKTLYDGLKDNTEVEDVEGLIDDVLVVTDPEITTDEYNEVIERAQEIIEDTPEGDIPLDPTYLGEYVQICPICGGSFIEDHILEPGTACPICFETPESFVMVGKLQAEDTVAENNGIENDTEPQLELDNIPLEEFGNEEVSEETEEETNEKEEEIIEPEKPIETPTENNRPRGARLRRNREVASKEIPTGNKLTEKLEEDIDTDDKKLLLGDESNDAVTQEDKEFQLVEADEDKIRELENNSAFTWEGMAISDDNLQAITDDLKERTKIKLPIIFYTWKGKLFNEMYGLTENNAYSEDLNFLSIDLDNWDGLGNLPIYKMQVGARWLDDIVDNNKYRQDRINGVENEDEE